MAKPQTGNRRKIASSDEDMVGLQRNTQSPNISPSKSSKASTPKKLKGKSVKNSVADKSNGKTLYSFFNAATEKQRAKATTPEVVQIGATQDKTEDIFDDVSDAGSNSSDKGGTQSSKKRTWDAVSEAQLGRSNTAASGISKFLKRSDGNRTVPLARIATIESDTRPWTEKYAPRTVEELVVHKKKVSDVRQWLQRSLDGDKYKRLLVLKGAAGSGKTKTVSILASTLGFDLVEWQNPTVPDHSSGDYSSIATQFQDFLGRARQYGRLDMTASRDSFSSSSDSLPREASRSGNAQLLLVEEFPNNIGGSSTASQTFRSSLLQNLSATAFEGAPPAPLILIISESILSDSSSSKDNFTAHRILGPEILSHPCTSVIEFNAVAPTFIAKALNLVLQKRSRDVGRYYAPHPDVLKKIAEFGDVRNAVSTLEFLCLQTEDDAKMSKLAPKKRQSNAPAGSDVDSQLALVALRATSLGLFHAVGKVVYNKRIPIAPQNGPLDELALSQLPEHLSQYSRLSISEVNCDALMDETGTDTSTFVSALHENYLLSCQSRNGSVASALDIINGCLDALCDADVLSGTNGSRTTRQGGAGEELRQSELAFQLAVKGILFSLPSPVKREPPPGRGKLDAHRMFYPASLKLWRKRGEIHDIISILTSRAMGGRLIAGIRHDSPLSRGSADGSVHEESHFDATTSLPLGSGQSAVQEMLLERLPYIVISLSANHLVSTPATVRQIRQVTRFTGVRLLQDDDEYDEAPSAFDNVSKLEDADKRGLGFFATSKHRNVKASDDLNVQKLMLSDDDIEDD